MLLTPTNVKHWLMISVRKSLKSNSNYVEHNQKIERMLKMFALLNN